MKKKTKTLYPRLKKKITELEKTIQTHINNANYWRAEFDKLKHVHNETILSLKIKSDAYEALALRSTREIPDKRSREYRTMAQEHKFLVEKSLADDGIISQQDEKIKDLQRLLASYRGTRPQWIKPKKKPRKSASMPIKG